MRALARLIIAVVVVTPGIAAAGDVGCVWRALPENARTGALKAYADDHPEKIFDGVAEEVLGEAIVKCISLPKNERAITKVSETVGLALAGYAAQLNAESKLGQNLKIDPEALSQAYGRIDPKLRREMAVVFRTDRKSSTALSNALVKAMSEAYPAVVNMDTDGPDFALLAGYFAARALREEAESKF